MPDAALGALFAAGLVLGWAATGGVRAVVVRTGVLDRPNRRSSHARPTPTLGGLGMVVGMWGALGTGAGLLGLAMPPGWGGLLGATGVLCFLARDEVRPMGRGSKLAVQTAAAALVTASGTVLERVTLPGGVVVALGPAAYPATLLGLVALQNLYNFMDGLDGLAGLEGVLVAGLFGGLAAGLAPGLAPASIALAGGALGLLLWNLPPARIFMGDVGANFLGLAFGTLAVQGQGRGIPVWVTALFLGAFLFDSLYTIVRRALRGENITMAHRFHLYQRLNRMGWGAGWVDFLYGACTLGLGGVGYAYLEGYAGTAEWAAAGIAVLSACGTAWVERVWREKGEQA